MCDQNENINKEVENLKRYEKEILKLKSTITKMKISLEGFKGRFEQAEEIITKPEDKTIEIIKSEEQKGKNWRKANRA